MFRSRWYQGSADLDRIKALLVAGRAMFRFGGYRHLGDIDWALWYGHYDADRTKTILLWEDDGGELIGYAMLMHRFFEFEVAPHLRGSPLEEAIVDDCEAQIAATMDVSPADAGILSGTDAFTSDAARVAMLERRGYVPSIGYSMLARSLRETIDEPRAPDGYVVRHVNGPADAEQRAAAHFHAFSPGSKMTADAYRKFMTAPGYRTNLDSVVVAPDGRIAAYSMAWIDEVNRVGEFEPVGTQPDFQRMGLGKAAMSRGLRALRDYGMDDAIVSTNESNIGAMRLYEAVGFRRVDIHQNYERRR